MLHSQRRCGRLTVRPVDWLAELKDVACSRRFLAALPKLLAPELEVGASSSSRSCDRNSMSPDCDIPVWAMEAAKGDAMARVLSCDVHWPRARPDCNSDTSPQ